MDRCVAIILRFDSPRPSPACPLTPAPRPSLSYFLTHCNLALLNSENIQDTETELWLQADPPAGRGCGARLVGAPQARQLN